MLFDPARHEPLSAEPWSAAAARQAIERIAADAEAAFDPQAGWPAHPLDDPERPGQRFHMLYMGSAGVVWALRDLAEAGALELQTDFAPFVVGLLERNREVTEAWGHGTASYLMGDSGLLLLQWRFSRDEGTAERLYATVEGNFDHPAREALWGNPGSVLAAIVMAEQTGDPRWRALVERALQHLWQQMERDPATGVWHYVQDMYGHRTRYLGAAHGFVGNVFPALRAAAWLDPALLQGFTERALETLQATALREDGLANWHPMIDAARVRDRLPLVQDCHGAPGIVCRLAGAPRTPEWDELLTAAGELTWRAGPLEKGASLCHGTAGSAMACLKLFRRVGDERWLERARALAMHAIGQVERHRAQYGQGRHSLWTGDLGLACVLWQCVVAGDRFPTLDPL